MKGNAAPRVPEPVPTPEPLAARFAALGIAAQSYAHAPVFRVGEGEDIKRGLPGGHTKNLFLKDKKDKIWLVVAQDVTQIDLKTLPRRIDAARLSFGSPALLEEILGVTPGSVTPFALINDTALRVGVILDKSLMGHTLVNFHPLKNDKTTAITPQDLLKFIRSCGHTPVIVDFTRC